MKPKKPRQNKAMLAAIEGIRKYGSARLVMPYLEKRSHLLIYANAPLEEHFRLTHAQARKLIPFAAEAEKTGLLTVYHFYSRNLPEPCEITEK